MWNVKNKAGKVVAQFASRKEAADYASEYNQGWTVVPAPEKWRPAGQ